MDGVLPSDKVGDLRRVVDRLLRDSNVYGQIREVLADYATREAGMVPSTDHVLGLVQEKGVISSLINSVDPHTLRAAPTHAAAQGDGNHRQAVYSSHGVGSGVVKDHRYLHCRFMGGRAFLEHLDTDPVASTVLHGQGGSGDRLVAHLQFGGQRFVSSSVECLCDPEFDDSFLLDLDEELLRAAQGNPKLTRFSGSQDLLKLDTKLHVVILRVDAERCTRRYVGENTIEWREVLKTGILNLYVEVGGGGQGLKVPVGMLEMQLELLPVQPNIGPDDVANRLNAERSNATAADREFLVYARRWWQEYHGVSELFQNRHVKVFASFQSHTAQTACVTSFVQPLVAERILDSPLVCARYVSLLTYDKDDDSVSAPHGVARDTSSWVSLFTFIAKGKGGTAEHANLLCSLLLGHGLDAWVALGVDERNEHKCCVITRGAEFHDSAALAAAGQRYSAALGGGAQYGNEFVTFWDVLTGVRYRILPHAEAPQETHLGVADFAEWGAAAMTRIHCAYTADGLVANVQAEDHATTTSFDFFDERLWKAMNPIKLKLVQKHPVPTINPSVYACPAVRALSLPAVEAALEKGLTDLVTAHREQLGIPTLWNQGRVAHSFSQALWNYEHQKATGVALDSRMFQASLKAAIQKGQHCRAFPVNFSHTSASRIMRYFVANRHTGDIIALQGDEVQHTLRVKITPYAEEAVSVWVMLAAVYRT